MLLNLVMNDKETASDCLNTELNDTLKTEIVFSYKTDSNNLIYNILLTSNYITVQSPFNLKND